RQFALGSKSDHVTRRNRGIVDDDARRLCPSLRGLAGYIVEGSCRHLCDRRKLVQKGDQSDAHSANPSGVITCNASRATETRIGVCVMTSPSTATYCCGTASI